MSSILHRLSTAARVTISISALLGLSIAWLALFPTSGQATLPPDESETVRAQLVVAASAAAKHHESPAEPLENGSERAPSQELVEVPDVTKLPVWVARKRLRQLGLEPAFASPHGSALRKADYSYHYAHRQQPSPGRMVDAGTNVQVSTKMRFQYASAY